jgi:TrmH family RNA methyltransferase
MTGRRLHVVLVRPQTPGNVGAAARAARNFGVEALHVVGEVPTSQEVEERARDALHLVEEAPRYGSVDEVAGELDHLAGFTARTSGNPKRHTREAVPLDEWAGDLREVAGDVGLVFGPERSGLDNEALMACDVPVTIPTSDDYPSMNLSHAVAVGLYAAADTSYEDPAAEVRPMDAESRQLLHEAFGELLDVLDLEDRYRTHTTAAWKRIMGRAAPSKWEYHRLMGVLRDAAEAAQDADGDEGDPG